MDVPLYGDNEADYEHEPSLSKTSSISNNFKRVSLATRRASNLLDHEEMTGIEISELLIRQGFSQIDVDRVTASGAKDIHQAIDLLTENESSQPAKLKGDYECLICGADVVSSRVILFGCDHVFCLKCLSDYLALKVNEGQVLSIRCPQHKCPTILTDQAVLKYLDAQLHDKYQKFCVKGELSKDPHLRWCPRLNCEGYSSGSSGNRHLTCGVCLHEYCYYCLEAWHGESACREYADQLLDAWAKDHNVRYCPNCRFRVEKMMGCSHMACIQCQYQWCWLCGDHWIDGHFASCSEFKRWWHDPSVSVIVLCLVAPFTMMFLNLFVIVLIMMALTEGEHTRLARISRDRYVTLTLMFLLSLLVSPLLFLAFVIGFPIYLAVETCRTCNCNGCVKFGIVLFMVLYIGLLLSSLMVGSLLLILLGLVMIATKIFVKLRSCFTKHKGRGLNYNAMW